MAEEMELAQELQDLLNTTPPGFAVIVKRFRSARFGGRVEAWDPHTMERFDRVAERLALRLVLGHETEERADHEFRESIYQLVASLRRSQHA